MSPLLRNILALIAGIVVGNIVNMGLVQIGMSLIPPPAGMDFNDLENIGKLGHLLEFKNMIFPWLAHGLGTLFGAYVAARFAATYKLRLALVIGFFFLIGGIYMVKLLNPPILFSIIDIVLAYIPMAWLGYKLQPDS